MTSAREEILGRVRAALADVTGTAPASEPVLAPPGARPPAGAGLLDHFAERVADYRATVERCHPDDLPAAVAAALPHSLPRTARVVVPPGLEGRLGFAVPGVTVDDGSLGAGDLDGHDAVVTACRVGIAETGTIVLDHEPDQGRRAISLVPDRHVCVVYADQVVADVPDAFPLLDPRRPLTWISGPSATSDIELDRVEGVHGPRHLHVIVVDPA
ncbi:LUD domain-containing protein [Nocardioides humi]|uniref:LUD domain-containing protein n=1 Tax=Nocardioides humi TaxID=449461 RepID=A0ABN2ADE6_9ACTN